MVATTIDGIVAFLVVGSISPETTEEERRIRPSWAQHTFWARDARSKIGVHVGASGTLTLRFAGCGDVQGDLVRTTRRALGHARLACVRSSVAILTGHSTIQRETARLAFLTSRRTEAQLVPATAARCADERVVFSRMALAERGLWTPNAFAVFQTLPHDTISGVGNPLPELGVLQQVRTRQLICRLIARPQTQEQGHHLTH
mmetsp:Transcript_62914/g.166902  ORF Transcript_62914/g.166902 Transcript_62914/m.166902 type:complete len:202 (-) Transcript_62914:1226-1831(-)